jgi:radical SAM protein with 4Fe4S-binding SPASM domain
VDIFDYADHLIYNLARAHVPERPLQIELHPGLHCDRYQCPHCFGHGQRALAGLPVTAAAIDLALAEIAMHDPLIVVSGITTEPLTHPEASMILHAVRRRNLRLGLYTKGLRFDAACAEAMVTGDAECFVTFSLDAFNATDYHRLHAIAPGLAERGPAGPGTDYFERVIANIRALYEMKLHRGAAVQVRIAILLFRENCDPDEIAAVLAPFTEIADLVRFAVPQDRNDGARVRNLPSGPRSLLADLQRRFAGHPKVRVLEDTFEPTRDRSFGRCNAQRFQVTIDKAGNLFPCPQVAVADYAHLSFGNLSDAPLTELLRSTRRREMFGHDVDRDMRCRICDRKDEAVNRALGRLDLAPFARPRQRPGAELPLAAI